MIPLRPYKRKYVTVYRYSLLTEALAGHPSKNSNNRKIESAGHDGRREKAGATLLPFPFPSCPARYKEASTEERVTGTCPYHWRGWGRGRGRGDGLISGRLRWPCNGGPSRY